MIPDLARLLADPSVSVRDLQDALRQTDRNGWLTLGDDEQQDAEILRDALTEILNNS